MSAIPNTWVKQYANDFADPVFRKRLTPFQREFLLFLRSNPFGWTDKSARDFARIFGVTDRTIRRALHRFEDLGKVRLVRSSGGPQKDVTQVFPAEPLRTEPKRRKPSAAPSGPAPQAPAIPAAPIEDLEATAALEASATERAGDAPADLLDTLIGILRWKRDDLDALPQPERWRMLEHLALWPRPETIEATRVHDPSPRHAAIRLIRAWHARVRQVEGHTPILSEVNLVEGLVKNHGAVRAEELLDEATVLMRRATKTPPNWITFLVPHLTKLRARWGAPKDRDDDGPSDR